MPSLIRTLFISSGLLAAVSGQGVVLSAKGDKGTSLGLQVQTNKADANIINATEISENVVNECGRTLLAGNIDIGENTEDQLGNGTVTQVKKGSKLTVLIAQGDSDGAGPYTCDMDMQSNAAGTSGQIPLNVTETDGANGQITLAMTMPQNMACTGASTGNVCTVRCFNKAAAGPFGGCVAVQQTDVTANKNTPANIPTAQTLEGIQAQVLQDQKDLAAAVKANQQAPTQDQQGLFAVDDLLNIDSAAQATVSVAAAAAAATGTTATTTGNKGNKGGNGAKAAGGNAAKAAGGNAKGGANAAGNNAAGNNAGAGNGNAKGAANNKNARAFTA